MAANSTTRAWAEDDGVDSARAALDTEAVARALGARLHASFERVRKERWASQIEAKNEVCRRG